MEQKQSIKGLNDQEVILSREKYGANMLTPPPKVSLWRIFLTKFEDPIIIILLVAITASFAVSCFHYWGEDAGFIVFLEPLGIAIAALLATAIGFLFEHNANKKFEMLNQVNDEISVKVIRNDIVCEVAKKDIVVADIVLLNAGDEVPADGELYEAVSLQLNESTLTGEP
ncbi:MAG: cation-transporting P-type ATPase, partial [Tannerellaceae bacterium]